MLCVFWSRHQPVLSHDHQLVFSFFTHHCHIVVTMYLVRMWQMRKDCVWHFKLAASFLSLLPPPFSCTLLLTRVSSPTDRQKKTLSEFVNGNWVRIQKIHETDFHQLSYMPSDLLSVWHLRPLILKSSNWDWQDNAEGAFKYANLYFFIHLFNCGLYKDGGEKIFLMETYSKETPV